MLVGVVSDTHNNIKNIDKIISLFNSEGVSLVIHTGDIANAASLEKFSKLHSDLIGVYGNNDRNEIGIREIVTEYNFSFKEPPYLVNVFDRTIAIFHEPDSIEEFLQINKKVDVVLHGHTHRYRLEKLDDVIFFNPGESAGMQVGKNAIGILNLKNLETRRIFF